MTDGGASSSTEPAHGSSTGTEVSLREYLSQKIVGLDRHLGTELEALRRESELANQNSQRAIEVAAQEAKERLIAHNGLIEQMRQQAEVNQRNQSAQAATFATRESLEDSKLTTDKRLSRIERFQAQLVGGMILLSVIGVANLVKIWTGS